MNVRRGFTLAELLVATVLTSVVATAALRVLLRQQQLTGQLAGRARANTTLRIAAAVLRAELRAVSTADPLSLDLLELGPSAIAYRATRGLSIICRAPDAAGRFVVYQDPVWALRGTDPARDSLLLFIDNDPGTDTDDRWLARNLVQVSGDTCPNGTPGTAYDTGAGAIPGVVVGGPVSRFEIVRIRLYTGGDGARWLGLQTTSKGTGWNPIQPVVGPLAVDGLQFSYLDAGGAAVLDPSRVAGVGIVLTASAGGGAAVGAVTIAALRNRG